MPESASQFLNCAIKLISHFCHTPFPKELAAHGSHCIYKLQLIMDESMWTVLFRKVFEPWLHEQEEGLQEKVLADLLNLQNYGPRLPRPYADTVKGSR